MSLTRDLSLGARRLLSNRAFTLVAVLTLALGIGATTAIYTVVDQVLLRPLPFEEPERLVHLWATSEEQPGERLTVSPADFLDWQERNESFESLAAYVGEEAGSRSRFTLTGGGEPEQVQGSFALPEMFEVLAVEPIHGRTFSADEVGEGNDRVVILSHGLWQRRFEGDPSVIGQTVSVNDVPRTIAGVMPEGFNFPSQSVQIWVPFGFDFSRLRQAHFFQVVGRLAEGVSPQQAEQEISSIAQALEEEYPATNEGWNARLVTLSEWTVGDTRPVLVTLLVAVGFVLLIACANVANLLLAQGAGRNREMALRSALGAERSRVVRQLLSENFILGILGGILGLVLAFFAVRFVVRWGPTDIPRLQQSSLDLRVLAVALGVTLATVLIFGLLPAIKASRTRIAASLQAAGRSGDLDRRGQRTRRLLVAVEVAMAVVLVIAAGLMIRSFAKLQQVDPGFRAPGLVTYEVSLPRDSYPRDQTTAFFQRYLSSLENLPGVESVSAASGLPLDGLWWSGNITIEGRPAQAGEAEPEVRHQEIMPGYFETLGVPMVEGRSIRAGDTAQSPPVLVVNQAFVERFLDGGSALGRRIKFGSAAADVPWWSIVGVVSDLRQDSLQAEVAPEVYEPQAQNPQSALSVVIRTDGEPMDLVPAARRELRRLDPALPMSNLRTGAEIVESSISRSRFAAALLLGFAVVALTLAIVGIYGITSYFVRQRTRELGIRMALGARPGDVRGLVLKRGMLLVGAGLVLGILAAFATTRMLSGLLYGVATTDPAIYLAVPGILLAVAFVACWIPANRASRVDPAVSLRLD